MQTPKFQHNCDQCIFMGRAFTDHPREEVDTYWCPTQLDGLFGGSVIARFGDNGPEYTSSPVAMAFKLTDPVSDGSMTGTLVRLALELVRRGKVELKAKVSDTH